MPDIVEGITRVRAAKTSGDCRKAIADASHLMGIASTQRDNYKQAEEALQVANLSPEVVTDMLSNISAGIVTNEREASKCLDSVINAVGKVLDEVKDLKGQQKLDAVRNLFATVEHLIPQTTK